MIFQRLHNHFHHSDGLWDVLSNSDVYQVIKKIINEENKEKGANSNENLCQNLAKSLVIKAKGVKSSTGLWYMSSDNNQLASGDDITCIALPISKVNTFLK